MLLLKKKKRNISLTLSPFSPTHSFSLSLSLSLPAGPRPTPRPISSRAAHSVFPFLSLPPTGGPRLSGSSPSRERRGLQESGRRTPRAALSFLARTPRLGPRPYLRRPHPPGTLLSPIEPQPPPQFAQTLAAAIVELGARVHAAPPLRRSSSTSSPPRSFALRWGFSSTRSLPLSRSFPPGTARRSSAASARRRAPCSARLGPAQVP